MCSQWHLGIGGAIGQVAVVVPAGAISTELQQERGDEGVGGAGSLHHHPCRDSAAHGGTSGTVRAAAGRLAPTGDVGGLQQVQLQEGEIIGQRLGGIIRGGPALQRLPGATTVQPGSVCRALRLLR